MIRFLTIVILYFSIYQTSTTAIKPFFSNKTTKVVGKTLTERATTTTRSTTLTTTMTTSTTALVTTGNLMRTEVLATVDSLGPVLTTTSPQNRTSTQSLVDKKNFTRSFGMRYRIFISYFGCSITRFLFPDLDY